MAEILHEVGIAAPPDQVYKALTEQSGLASWWATDLSADPTVGATLRVGFDHGQHVLEVLTLEADHKVGWICTQSFFPDWIGTRISFELTPLESGTKLLFSQRGFASAEGSLPKVSFGWAMYLNSLKAYLETGKGSPYQS